MVLTCEGLCILHCTRVDEDKIDHNINIPFSILPALEDGYFSDTILMSANNKQVIPARPYRLLVVIVFVVSV